MVDYHAYIQQYKKFMKTFRNLYPDLYRRYGTCIAKPKKGRFYMQIADGVAVKPMTRQMLLGIIAAYYEPLYN